MGDMFLFLLLIFLFAWVARAMLGARQVTWRRTILAAVFGIFFGQTVGVLLLIRDVGDAPALTPGEVMRVSLPFALIGRPLEEFST